jgi:hypothetical protein
LKRRDHDHVHADRRDRPTDPGMDTRSGSGSRTTATRL